MPVFTGIILSVNLADRKGMKKSNVDSSRFVEGVGLQADAHAGSEIRQVSLLARESIDKIRAKGLDVQYFDLAENLTTEGIDLPSLPVCAKLKIGSGILLEVTQIGKVCHDRCHIFYMVGDCVMPCEGVFARVLSGGNVKTGDSIVVIR